METTTQNRELAVIKTSLDVFQSAPQVLKANQDRSVKAKAVGQSIIEQWHQAWNTADEEARMTALSAADERSNKYLVNCATALKEEKEARAAITQMMDMFKKLFTEAENDLDKTKDGTTTSKVQLQRNAYASEIFKINEQKRKEAERVAAKSKEAIDIKSNTEKSLYAAFTEYLLQKKQKLQSAFNSLVLEGFADNAASIRLYEPKFTIEQFSAIMATTGFFSYHSKEEVGEIVKNTRMELYPKFSQKYIDDMNALRQEIVDKIPSKHEELKEQKRLDDEAAEAKRKSDDALKKTNDENERIRLKAIADKAEADKLQAEKDRQDREQKEALELQQKADQDKKDAEQAVDIKSQGEQTMVLFEQEAAVAENTPAPATRQGYNIVVLHQVGYTEIFTLWFQQEGKNLPVDKIGNTKLDQMKTWCEKYALKTNTKIESKFLKYEDSIKAVNKKEK